jgi:hypothetical protein
MSDTYSASQGSMDTEMREAKLTRALFCVHLYLDETRVLMGYRREPWNLR